MPGDELRLFDRVKILALEVLLRADQQHLLVANRAHDDWQDAWLATIHAHLSPRRAPPMAVDELKHTRSALLRFAVRSHNQHPLKAGRAHPLGKIFDALVAEGLASLIRAILDQCIRDLLNLLTWLRLAIDHLINGRVGASLPAPADPCASFAAHGWVSRKAMSVDVLVAIQGHEAALDRYQQPARR